jgi:hypothetical protein
MPSNGAGRGFCRPGERRACTRGAHLRQPVFRRNGPLRRWAKLPPVQLFGARGEETGKWRRWASVVPLTVGHAPSRRPRSPPMDRVWIGCAGHASRRMKKRH